MSTLVEHGAVTVADLVEALRPRQHPPPAGRVPLANLPAAELSDSAAARTAVVVGAHPGAGATAVAVAVADATATPGSGLYGGDVCLVDAARRGASGMSAATACEVGGGEDGWRAGRRGTTTILRPAASPACPSALPPIRVPDSGRLVVDAGWPWRDVLADPNPIRALAERAQVLLVGRASVPGVHHLELALNALPGRPLVAAVGARRWPATVMASSGPRLARAVNEGRAVLIPSDRGVKVNGIDLDPFPRAVDAAARQLAELLWPQASGTTQERRRKGLRR
jgi:hypothetical protein